MKEYLATTSLGDLVRKSKETESEIGQANITEATPAAASAIRSPIGEINQ